MIFLVLKTGKKDGAGHSSILLHPVVAATFCYDLTAGFLYTAGAENPLNFREKFRSGVSPRTTLVNFSVADTQTAVLVSTAEVWVSAPDTQTPILFGFRGIHSWLWFFCRETKIFGYFPEVPVTKIRVSAPAPYKNPTVMTPCGIGSLGTMGNDHTRLVPKKKSTKLNMGKMTPKAMENCPWPDEKHPPKWKFISGWGQSLLHAFQTFSPCTFGFWPVFQCAPALSDHKMPGKSQKVHPTSFCGRAGGTTFLRGWAKFCG